jgi:hypothetical protein
VKENKCPKKTEKIIITNFSHKKNNCDDYGQKVKNDPFFKTFFGFSFLDIFKNVQFLIPFLLFEKYL